MLIIWKSSQSEDMIYAWRLEKMSKDARAERSGATGQKNDFTIEQRLVDREGSRYRKITAILFHEGM